MNLVSSSCRVVNSLERWRNIFFHFLKNSKLLTLEEKLGHYFLMISLVNRNLKLLFPPSIVITWSDVYKQLDNFFLFFWKWLMVCVLGVGLWSPKVTIACRANEAWRTHLITLLLQLNILLTFRALSLSRPWSVTSFFGGSPITHSTLTSVLRRGKFSKQLDSIICGPNYL